jgi:molybdopterin-guanine dinucleotide biosynthesis protein A
VADDLRYDAVVLAGGRSRRMHVADKTALAVGGVPLLDRVLAATSGADSVVVVGSSRPVARDVTWVREDPPGGGPAAAVTAALDVVSADVVVLLAGDLPLLTTEDVDRLATAVVADGAVFVDDAGVEQWLCSAWRASSLRAARLEAGGSLRGALAPLTFVRLPAAEAVLDCDTPDDVRRAEEMLT